MSSPQYRSLLSRIVSRHIEQLALDAAAILHPEYEQEVQVAVAGCDRDGLEMALAAKLAFTMPDARSPGIHVSRGVEGFSSMLEERADAVARLEAVRGAVGTSPTALLSPAELEELGLPAAICDVGGALKFARACKPNRDGSRGLVMHRYGILDGSLTLSTPAVTLVGASMGLDPRGAAQLAVALLSAHRVLRKAQDADGDGWYAASAQRAAGEVWHGLTGWLLQLALPVPCAATELRAWQDVASSVRDYYHEVPILEDARTMGDSLEMTAERLRGLVVRARRSMPRSLDLGDLLLEERRGAQPTYPAALARLVGPPRATHRPDPAFVRNERAVLRLMAKLLDLSTEDLENTGRQELDDLVDEGIVHVHSALQAILDATRKSDKLPTWKPGSLESWKSLQTQLLQMLDGKAPLWSTAPKPGASSDASKRDARVFVWDPRVARQWPALDSSETNAAAKALLIELLNKLREAAAALEQGDAAAQEGLIFKALIEGEVLPAEEPAPDAPRGPLLLPPGEPSAALEQPDATGAEDAVEPPACEGSRGAGDHPDDTK